MTDVRDFQSIFKAYDVRGTVPDQFDDDMAGAIGAACTSDATCSSNTLCSTYNAQQRCRKVCTRPAGNECATVPGTTCVGFGTPGLVIGGTEYGVCAP